MSIDSTLYVQGVPAGVTQDEFEAAVTGAAKEVSKVNLNERKRYAHVVFESHEAAEKGIKSLKKASIGGEHLEFDWSKPKESSKPEFDEANNKTVFVTGLSTSTETEEVQTAFADYGEIERVFVVNNKTTKSSAGKAVVEFKTRSAAEKALELNETELGGQTITVEFAKAPRTQKNTQRGGRSQSNGGSSRKPAQKRKADDDEEDKPAKKAKSTETKKDTPKKESAASTKKDTPKKETAPTKKDTPKKETTAAAASPKKETPKKAATPSKSKGKK